MRRLSSGASLRIGGAYLVTAALWILLSGHLVLRLPPALQQQAETLKGLGFVVVTSVLLYVLLRDYESRVERHAASLEREIDQRRATEVQLRRLSRVNLLMARCNQAVFHAPDEPTLLRDVCHLIVREGGYWLAWVGYARDDGAVPPAAWAGAGEEYLETAVVTWGDDARGEGPTGTAIRSGRPSVWTAAEADPPAASWQAEMLAFGFRTSIGLPLNDADRRLGALTIYSSDAGAFDSAEISLLAELADDIAYGITARRTRDERARAEAERRKQRDLLARVMETNPVAIFLLDAQERLLTANAAGHELLQLLPEVVEDDRLDLSSVRLTDTAGNPLPVELFPSTEARRNGAIVRGSRVAYRRPNGQVLYFLVSAAPLVDDQHAVEAVVVAAQDITESVAVTQMLEESRERYRLLLDSLTDHAIITLDPSAVVSSWNAGAERVHGFRAADILGRPFATLFSDDDNAGGLPESVLDGARREGRYEAEGWRMGRDQSRFWGNTLVAPVRDERGQLLGYSVVTQDLTERKRAQEAIARQARRLELLHHVDRLILTARAEETARAVLNYVVEVFPCYRASVVRLQRGGQARVVAAWSADAPEGGESAAPLLTDYAEVAAKRAVVLRRGDGDTGTLARLSPAPAAAGVRSYVAVPLAARQTLGVLELCWREDRALADADRDVVIEIADQLAIALENARLLDEVRGANDSLQALSRRLVEVQEAERRAISRELHDEIGQSLTGIGLMLELSARQVPSDTRRHLEDAIRLTGELTARVRELSLDLRPAMLDDFGLMSALLWLFRRYEAQTGVRVAFEQQGLDRRFSPELETAAYRLVQEALTNVARHAGVGEAGVRLWVDADSLQLEVDDAGIGFDPQAPPEGRMTGGLSGMQERATLLGGELHVESAPGAGTHLRARFPLDGFSPGQET